MHWNHKIHVAFTCSKNHNIPKRYDKIWHYLGILGFRLFSRIFRQPNFINCQVFQPRSVMSFSFKLKSNQTELTGKIGENWRRIEQTQRPVRHDSKFKRLISFRFVFCRSRPKILTENAKIAILLNSFWLISEWKF